MITDGKACGPRGIRTPAEKNDHARPKRRTQPSAVIHVAPDPCRETAAHRACPGRRGCLQRHALSACLRRRGGERAHSPGQRGQTQRTHPDHRSDSASCAVRRGHGARPDHRPVPCVWAARRALRYGRVHRQLHCTGESGGRGSGDQSRVLETSGDGYHRAESRAARDISHRQFSAFSAWHARLRSLPCRREGRASPSARALFDRRGAYRAPCIRAGTGSRPGPGDPCDSDRLAGGMAVGTRRRHRRLQPGKRDQA